MLPLAKQTVNVERPDSRDIKSGDRGQCNSTSNQTHDPLPFAKNSMTGSVCHSSGTKTLTKDDRCSVDG